jgi:hypothetical protein
MDQVTVPRATVQEALGALEAGPDVDPIFAGETEVALRAALEQPNVEQPKPPPEAQTEAERLAYCAGWWAAMEQKREQPAQEPVAWRTFDGEGGYDYRTYDDNENYRNEWDKRNPNHKGWVEPLYTHHDHPARA